ncbi:MAG: winged helix-turn-helix domain-containing protein [Pseudomonadota bacterium]
MDDEWIYDAMRWRLIAPGGRGLQLSLIESQLIACLLSRCGEVVTREELLRCLYQPCTETRSRNLDVVVSRLRKKVESRCGQKLPVGTARGLGYVFVARGSVVK